MSKKLRILIFGLGLILITLDMFLTLFKSTSNLMLSIIVSTIMSIIVNTIINIALP